jgi:hypothetical protein
MTIKTQFPDVGKCIGSEPEMITASPALISSSHGHPLSKFQSCKGMKIIGCALRDRPLPNESVSGFSGILITK